MDIPLIYIKEGNTYWLLYPGNFVVTAEEGQPHKYLCIRSMTDGDGNEVANIDLEQIIGKYQRRTRQTA